MASPEWIETFRSFTGEELAAQILALKKQISVYSSQQIGSKSYVKDMSALKDQLHAAVRVQNERSHSSQGSGGYVDFSQVQI